MAILFYGSTAAESVPDYVRTHAPVKVGRRQAYVVRRTGAGVGVRFVLPLRAEDVTEDVAL